MNLTRFVRPVAWVAVAFWLVFGIWAFVAPRSFFDQVAVFPPYNEHFLHDAGAFQMGLGAVLVFGLIGWDGLGTALAGTAVAAVMHVIAHAIDSDKGGKSTDIPGLAVLALALVVAAVLARPGPRPKHTNAP
jgi:peptidoglycan/LPS O-acetylase OafA/YrhL